MSESVVDREEIEEIMWALADTRVDAAAVRWLLMGEDEEEEEEPQDDS